MAVNNDLAQFERQLKEASQASQRLADLLTQTRLLACQAASCAYNITGSCCALKVTHINGTGQCVLWASKKADHIPGS